MSDYTLFTSVSNSGNRESVDDPQFAYQQNNVALKTTQNIKWYKSENWLLDLADTKLLNYPSYALSDQTIIIARVIGWAELRTTAKDFDDTTNITGVMRAHGNTVYPGYFYLSSYNLITYTFEGLEDGTVIEIFFGVRE